MREQYKKTIQLAAARSLPANSKSYALRIIENNDSRLTKDIDLAKIIGIIGTLRLMVGDTSATESQLEMEANWIKSQYGNWPSMDIYYAFELFVKGDLDIPIPDYFKFSTLTLGKVFVAFIRFKNRVTGELDRVTEKDMLLLENVQTDEEFIKKRLQGIKDCILDCYSHYKEGFKERFYNRTVYDLLRKTSRIKLTDDLVKQSKEYAEKQWQADIEENRRKKTEQKKQDDQEGDQTRIPQPVGNDLMKPPALIYDRKQAIRAYAYEYILQVYFKANEAKINKIVSSVTVKDLEILYAKNVKKS